MKALFISDIHANIDALEAIWEHERDSDAIYCVGDLVDYGPNPRPVLDWMREHGAICVQGNHDREVAACFRSGVDLAAMPEQEVAWRHYNAARLSEQDIVFLEALPVAIQFTLDGIRYGMTHLYEDYQIITNLHAYEQFCTGMFPNEQGPPPRLVMGHTHRQAIHYLSDTAVWLNPGSISYRRRDDPDQTAHYMTITNGMIALHRLAYDVQKVYQQIHDLRLKDSEMEVAHWFFGPRQ